MVKRRIKNDLTLDWHISRCGEPELLDGRNLSVKLKNAFGYDETIAWSVEGDRVHVVFFGKDQRHLGKYMLVLTENEGLPDMAEVDAIEAFELVAHSKDETCGDIELQSDISIGRAGASAYEIAVKWGYVGSEEEWIGEYNKAVQDAKDAALNGVEQQTKVDTALANLVKKEEQVDTAEKARQASEQQRTSAESQREEGFSAAVQTVDDAVANANLTIETTNAVRVSTESAMEAANKAEKKREEDYAAAKQSIDETVQSANLFLENANAEESKRVEAEAKRGTAETSRASAEAARSETEALRAEEEAKRVSSESARSSAEVTREQHEASREASESLRVEDETKREQDYTASKQTITDTIATANQTIEATNTAKTKAETATANANAAAKSANDAAALAEGAVKAIDAKIAPVVESDKVQNEKIAALETSVTDLQRYHGDDYCVATYEEGQLAPEALDVRGSRSFALNWHPWLVDMTDNAGEAVTRAYTLKKNNWFRRASNGAFAPAVCITAEDWALCDAELYLDAAHTQKYCEAGAFDAETFYNEHGMAQKLYNVDGSEVAHIRRPWETTNKDLGQFVGRKDSVYLCDNLQGRSGKVLKGVFGSQTNYDGAQFGQFKLMPTGLAPSPVCTIGNKTRSFFYLMEGETNCKSSAGTAGCTDMFKDPRRTFPRTSDMQQINDMRWSRANNADPHLPVPFAEGGFHALNTFLTCMEVGYGTKFLHDADLFSSGISSNDSCSNEESWRHFGGVRLRKQGEQEYRYHSFGSTSEMCYNAEGGAQNLSQALNAYYPKVGVNEMQIAASYAAEAGVPEGQVFELYGSRYWWKPVAGAKSLAEGEMNCRMYKIVAGTYNGFLKDGTPQVWDVECVLRVGLIQGMNVSGDIFAYWGGGYEQIGHTPRVQSGGTGFPIELYLQPAQEKWKNISAVTIDDTETFGCEDSYIHVGSTSNQGDSYTLDRCAFAAFPEKRGGSIRTGECFYSWNNNYWCSTINKFTRIAARFRGYAHSGICSQRYLYAYHAVSSTLAYYAGSAQVMLGAAECNALQAQPQTQSVP